MERSPTFPPWALCFIPGVAIKIPIVCVVLEGGPGTLHVSLGQVVRGPGGQVLLQVGRLTQRCYQRSTGSLAGEGEELPQEVEKGQTPCGGPSPGDGGRGTGFGPGRWVSQRGSRGDCSKDGGDGPLLPGPGQPWVWQLNVTEVPQWC